MTLADYLNATSTDRGQFAKAIGVSAESVRRYEIGERIPTKEIMAKIALATSLKVTANDFFGIGITEKPDGSDEPTQAAA